MKKLRFGLNISIVSNFDICIFIAVAKILLIYMYIKIQSCSNSKIRLYIRLFDGQDVTTIINVIRL